jgi:serine/threonine protein kinase
LHNKIGNSFSIINFYGITQDPKTKNYMMILEYAKEGSLRNYLDTNCNKLSWDDKLLHLYYTASGLVSIHKNGLVHRDFHIGNILVSNYIKITDMGLCKPADFDTSENIINSTYGVLPYIAPEILRGQSYTKAADIYSFGIIMYEVISGLPPYHDVSHDENLAIRICQGLRPRFNIKVPRLIVHLIKKCLDTNPLNRPTAEEIEEILRNWRDNNVTKLFKNTKLPTSGRGILYETHSEAVYTSRLLNFDNLPESKNSDDYYDNSDNIISIKSSGTFNKKKYLK